MPIQKTTRTEILAACIRVFRRQGYYRSTMADLAAETGMTKGVFYHHFSSKEEIMLAALETSLEFFQQAVFSQAYNAELPVQERLENMIRRAFHAFSDELGGCFFANTVLETAHVEETFLPPVKAFFQSWEQALAYLFRYRHPEEEAAELARQSIIDVEGSLILMQLHKDKRYLQAALDRARERL